MMWRDVLSLVTVTIAVNSVGDSIETKSLREVFCNKKSVKSSEFYQAHATGLRPDFIFEVRLVDYQNEQVVRFGTTDYTVIRTYSKNDEIIEIVCQSVVN